MRLDIFVKLKHQSITIILSVGHKYSMRDLLCDVINNASHAGHKVAICVTYAK